MAPVAEPFGSVGLIPCAQSDRRQWRGMGVLGPLTEDLHPLYINSKRDTGEGFHR